MEKTIIKEAKEKLQQKLKKDNLTTEKQASLKAAELELRKISKIEINAETAKVLKENYPLSWQSMLKDLADFKSFVKKNSPKIFKFSDSDQSYHERTKEEQQQKIPLGTLFTYLLQYDFDATKDADFGVEPSTTESANINAHNPARAQYVFFGKSEKGGDKKGALKYIRELRSNQDKEFQDDLVKVNKLIEEIGATEYQEYLEIIGKKIDELIEFPENLQDDEKSLGRLKEYLKKEFKSTDLQKFKENNPGILTEKVAALEAKLRNANKYKEYLSVRFKDVNNVQSVPAYLSLPYLCGKFVQLYPDNSDNPLKSVGLALNKDQAVFVEKIISQDSGDKGAGFVGLHMETGGGKSLIIKSLKKENKVIETNLSKSEYENLSADFKKYFERRKLTDQNGNEIGKDKKYFCSLALFLEKNTKDAKETKIFNINYPESYKIGATLKSVELDAKEGYRCIVNIDESHNFKNIYSLKKWQKEYNEAFANRQDEKKWGNVIFTMSTATKERFELEYKLKKYEKLKAQFEKNEGSKGKEFSKADKLAKVKQLIDYEDIIVEVAKNRVKNDDLPKSSVGPNYIVNPNLEPFNDEWGADSINNGKSLTPQWKAIFAEAKVAGRHVALQIRDVKDGKIKIHIYESENNQWKSVTNGNEAALERLPNEFQKFGINKTNFIYDKNNATGGDFGIESYPPDFSLIIRGVSKEEDDDSLKEWTKENLIQWIGRVRNMDKSENSNDWEKVFVQKFNKESDKFIKDDSLQIFLRNSENKKLIQSNLISELAKLLEEKAHKKILVVDKVDDEMDEDVIVNSVKNPQKASANKENTTYFDQAICAEIFVYLENDDLMTDQAEIFKKFPREFAMADALREMKYKDKSSTNAYIELFNNSIYQARKKIEEHKKVQVGLVKEIKTLSQKHPMVVDSVIDPSFKMIVGVDDKKGGLKFQSIVTNYSKIITYNNPHLLKNLSKINIKQDEIEVNEAAKQINEFGQEWLKSQIEYQKLEQQIKNLEAVKVNCAEKNYSPISSNVDDFRKELEEEISVLKIVKENLGNTLVENKRLSRISPLSDVGDGAIIGLQKDLKEKTAEIEKLKQTISENLDMKPELEKELEEVRKKLEKELEEVRKKLEKELENQEKEYKAKLEESKNKYEEALKEAQIKANLQEKLFEQYRTQLEQQANKDEVNNPAEEKIKQAKEKIKQAKEKIQALETQEEEHLEKISKQAQFYEAQLQEKQLLIQNITSEQVEQLKKLNEKLKEKEEKLKSVATQKISEEQESKLLIKQEIDQNNKKITELESLHLRKIEELQKASEKEIESLQCTVKEYKEELAKLQKSKANNRVKQIFAAESDRKELSLIQATQRLSKILDEKEESINVLAKISGGAERNAGQKEIDKLRTENKKNLLKLEVAQDDKVIRDLRGEIAVMREYGVNTNEIEKVQGNLKSLIKSTTGKKKEVINKCSDLESVKKNLKRQLDDAGRNEGDNDYNALINAIYEELLKEPVLGSDGVKTLFEQIDSTELERAKLESAFPEQEVKPIFQLDADKKNNDNLKVEIVKALIGGAGNVVVEGIKGSSAVTQEAVKAVFNAINAMGNQEDKTNYPNPNNPNLTNTRYDLTSDSNLKTGNFPTQHNSPDQNNGNKDDAAVNTYIDNLFCEISSEKFYQELADMPKSENKDSEIKFYNLKDKDGDQIINKNGDTNSFRLILKNERGVTDIAISEGLAKEYIRQNLVKNITEEITKKLSVVRNCEISKNIQPLDFPWMNGENSFANSLKRDTIEGKNIVQIALVTPPFAHYKDLPGDAPIGRFVRVNGTTDLSLKIVIGKKGELEYKGLYRLEKSGMEEVKHEDIEQKERELIGKMQVSVSLITMEKDGKSAVKESKFFNGSYFQESKAAIEPKIDLDKIFDQNLLSPDPIANLDNSESPYQTPGGNQNQPQNLTFRPLNLEHTFGTRGSKNGLVNQGDLKGIVQELNFSLLEEASEGAPEEDFYSDEELLANENKRLVTLDTYHQARQFQGNEAKKKGTNPVVAEKQNTNEFSGVPKVVAHNLGVIKQDNNEVPSNIVSNPNVPEKRSIFDFEAKIKTQ